MSRGNNGEQAEGQEAQNNTSSTQQPPTTDAQQRLSEAKGQLAVNQSNIATTATTPTAQNGTAGASQRDSYVAGQQQIDAGTSGRPRAADSQAPPPPIQSQQPIATPGQQIPTASQAKLHHGASSQNIVGVHYKVGKKIGEGSFGIIYEGEILSGDDECLC